MIVPTASTAWLPAGRPVGRTGGCWRDPGAARRESRPATPGAADTGCVRALVAMAALSIVVNEIVLYVCDVEKSLAFYAAPGLGWSSPHLWILPGPRITRPCSAQPPTLGHGGVRVVLTDGSTELITGSRYLEPGTQLRAEMVAGQLQIVYLGEVLREYSQWLDYSDQVAPREYPLGSR
jgi:hypothetical protein